MDEKNKKGLGVPVPERTVASPLQVLAEDGSGLSRSTANAAPEAPSEQPELGLRIIVAGCRDFHDYEFVKRTLDFIFEKDKPETVLSGGANGVDALGERWARENNIPVRVCPADWNKNGKAAGPIRNAFMASKADGLVAFWDKKSRGTGNMIDIATKRGLALWVESIRVRTEAEIPQGGTTEELQPQADGVITGTPKSPQ